MRKVIFVETLDETRVIQFLDEADIDHFFRFIIAAFGWVKAISCKTFWYPSDAG